MSCEGEVYAKWHCGISEEEFGSPRKVLGASQ